ncbi:MAG: ABC transporter permease subunit [Thermostichales cyanobacterium SZTDM-1c_bins_54]
MVVRLGRSSWAWLWLGVAAVYLFLPLVAMVWASLRSPTGIRFDAYGEVLRAPRFLETFWFSTQAALITILASAGLVVPTAYWVELKLPRWRPLVEFLTVVPLVIPPLLMTFGLVRLFNNTPLTNSNQGLYVMMLGAYVVISFPFMYRAVDAGMQGVNLRVLTEAAQSLGASWLTILTRVVVPNLWVAILNGSFVTFALILGEFTIASLLNQPAFSPYMLDLSSRKGDQATALGVISIALTWGCIGLLQLLGRRRS